MRKTTLLAFTAVALLATAVPALAGGRKGDWEIGPYGGYMWADDYGSFHPEDHVFYGARLGYFLTPGWSLGLSAQRVPTETNRGIAGVAESEMKLDAARLDLAYNLLPGSAFRPFLAVGGGRERTRIEGIGTSTDWGWSAGGGFRLFFTPRFNLKADARYSPSKPDELLSERQKNVEATAGLNLVFGGRREAERIEAPQPPPVANQPPQVSCVPERTEVTTGENVSVTATASDPEGEPLNYTWSTTAGRVSGTGPTATLDLSGATPPATATVTVNVSDTHGNTANCQTTVSLAQPAPPPTPEAASCMAGGFPRNLSRLTNVDKACLDDFVQRLKADPRAHVVVIGHADSHERSPQTIAKRRADAIEDYLKSAGIETTRITTRSAGATRMASTGTDASAMAGNRRVEVWFVPEGAAEPQQ